MKFNEIKDFVNGKNKKDIIIRFSAFDSLGKNALYTDTSVLHDLIENWYVDSNLCPDNGSLLTEITLFYDSKAYPICMNIDDIIDFETLMTAVC